LHYTSSNANIHSHMNITTKPTDINDERTTPHSLQYTDPSTLQSELHPTLPFLLSKTASPLFLSNLCVQLPCLITKLLRRLRDPHLCTLLFLQRMGNAMMRTSFTTIINLLDSPLELNLCAMLCKVFFDDERLMMLKGAYQKWIE